ncbi:hypothetical protein [Rhizosaccharibacter radicis]|uniref:Uncharacterized protein n=1 Tax=Rhizosaccharibacter radicis TaxID=2782605 RepID=A0ABT1VZX9_9PROT|nr:hypothetical protein [Acetobacteraceae bacterium KSS12]
MKFFLFSAMVVASVAGTALSAAQASDLRMTVEKPHFTCEGRQASLQHTAYRPGDAERAAADQFDGQAPLPCCDGQIGCAQFLSTNTILRPHKQVRG